MSQQEGRKSDTGKSRLDLVVPGWMWEVGHVLGHGAKKYGPFNWQKVERERYHAALLRHTLALMNGETHDVGDTGFHHMALASCSAMFLWWVDEGNTIPTRTCQCKVCKPEQAVVTITLPWEHGHHATSTHLGG